MKPSHYMARARLIHGWRALVGLTLLIAVAGGLVLGGVSGARRTGSVVDRMVARTEASDVLVNPDEGDGSRLDMTDVAGLPMVASAAPVYPIMLLPQEPLKQFQQLQVAPLLATTDGHLLWDWGRPVVTAGRLPDPHSDTEVFVQKTYADAHGIDVGDRLPFKVLTVRDMNRLYATKEESQLAKVTGRPGFGRAIDLTVTGVGVTPDGIVVDEGFEPIPMYTGPTLYRELGEPKVGFWGAMVRLTSPDQLPEFEKAVNSLVPDELVVYQTRAHSDIQVKRATGAGAAAMWIFSGIAAVLSLLLVGQAVSRRLRSDSIDNSVLSALGTTRHERWLASLFRLVPAAAVGATLAAALAYALSWGSPVGPGRVAETDPGWSFDPIMAIGAVAVFVLVILAAALPAWRAAQCRPSSDSSRGSAIAMWLAARGAPFFVTTGVRFGLEPGRGRAAVPTRATIVGAATGVAVAVATLIFAASLGGVVSQPRYYGSNWDGAVSLQYFDLRLDKDYAQRRFVDQVIELPEVETANVLTVDEFRVNGAKQTGLSFADDGGIGPTIAEGRAPRSSDEIALGKITMDQLDVGIGDSVGLAAAGYEGPATVVGRAVLPGVGLYQGSDKTALGVGAVITPAAMGVDSPGGARGRSVVAFDVRPGVSVDDFYATLALHAPRGTALTPQPLGKPADIQSLARLEPLPMFLAGALVVLIAAMVTHALVVAVRSRRRDLAVLQTMGARRSSLRWVGVTQGMSIAVIASLIGVPAGVILGRWSWTWLATQFGTIAVPVVPVGLVAAFAAAVALMAAVAGLLPVHLGLRRTNAEVLRSE